MIVTLIGMPGSGKSCMGHAIAGKLKLKFCDMDKVIEKKYKKDLIQVLEENGNEGFSKIEEDTMLEVEGDNLLISTGGSAVYSDKAMQHLKSLGIVVYLYCSYETIEERLGDFSKRGIVLKENQTLRDLYNERIPLYEHYADLTVSCDGNAYPKYQANAIKVITKAMEKQNKQ